MSKLPQTRYSLLVRLASPDDAAAWTEFLDIYEGAVLRYCRSRGLQEADARDAAQEVLLAVHQAISDWEPSGRAGSFRAWLLQTAHRTCLKMLRRQLGRDRGIGGSSAQRRIEELARSDATGEADEHEWQRWAFCWAAGQVQREVQPATWQAFWQTTVAGQPIADAARELSLSVGSVYIARSRVMARLQGEVRRFEEEQT